MTCFGGTKLSRAVGLLIGLGLAVRILQLRGVGIEGAQLLEQPVVDAQLQNGPAIGISTRDITTLQKLVKNASCKGACIMTVD